MTNETVPAASQVENFVQPAKPAKSAHAGHIPALDGVRGAAIVLVMVHHFASVRELAPSLTRKIVNLTEIGWCGVDLFFVLSGFLITGILIQMKGTRAALRIFYIRRTLRIFPLYYVTLIGLFVLWPAMVTVSPEYDQFTGHQAWYWSYLTNFLFLFKLPNAAINTGHFWSLAVEEQFYLFWPFVVLFSSTKVLRWICGVIIVSALAYRIAAVSAGLQPGFAYILTFARLDALCLGALTAILIRDPELWVRAKRIAPYAVAAALTVFAAVVIVQGSFRRGPLMLTVGFSALAMVFSTVIGAAASGENKVVRSVAESRFLRFFGKYSYAMYVFHPFVIALMNPWFEPDGVIGSNLTFGLLSIGIFSLLGFVLTTVAALISWSIMEKPLLRLKHHFEPNSARTGK